MQQNFGCNLLDMSTALVGPFSFFFLSELELRKRIFAQRNAPDGETQHRLYLAEELLASVIFFSVESPENTVSPRGGNSQGGASFGVPCMLSRNFPVSQNGSDSSLWSFVATWSHLLNFPFRQRSKSLMRLFTHLYTTGFLGHFMLFGARLVSTKHTLEFILSAT